MGFIPAWIVACCAMATVSCDEPGQSIYKGLYDFVIRSSNPLAIPKQTLPISVGVQCGIVAIHGVDREKNVIDATRWGSVTWHSDLTWDPADFNGLRNVSIPYHSLWIPDLHLYNADSSFEFIREPSAVVFHHGLHAIFAHIRSKVHCGEELDRDTCRFRMASWSTSSDIVRINRQWENPFNMNKILASEEFKAAKYEVLSFQYTKKTVPLADSADTRDVMDFTFSFQEKNPPSYRGPFRAVFQWN